MAGGGGGGCLSSPTSSNRKLTSSFFGSPRLFETEAIMSPTSILEPFLGLRNSFWSESSSPRTPITESKRPWDSKGIGLAIVDALTEENSNPKPTKPETRLVLLGSQLKIQIPPLPPFVSPADEEFGIKTRNSHLGSSSPVSSLSPPKKSAFGSSSSSSGQETPNSPLIFTGCLSADEIEQSEDYTCVISHGPNPRTTHIFGDCVIESGSGVYSPARKENGTSFSPENFLSFCDNCKKNLEQGKDIYMYRGEKAFCSHECRFQEMMLEEEDD
ncbi:protein MARD1-like isoform X1 [Cucurbita pepo subsp. pepo]|uniref:protein MARD1-like isoform X1 n=1 Tax=Cucurbita pepo subsp. pepo TaxID=3664 RepID=UPI000C9D58D8|nr:protein MARD1-like isoform X1 [Cucurbita pepo subsp. pepo]